MKSYDLLKVLAFTLAAVSLSGMASADPISYVDENNRFILHGEPFFPLGLFVAQCPNESYTIELDEIADSPFDTVMNYAVNKCGADASEQQIRGYLDALNLRGMKVIFSVKDYVSGCDNTYAVCDTPGPLSAAAVDTITQKILNYMDHEAIIAWYMNDESCPDCLEQLEDGYRLIKMLDNNRPVWSVHWNTNWLLQEVHTTDLVGVDPYPIPDNPITWVSDMADEASTSGLPLWLVPQIFDWSDYGRVAQPPTKKEMRAMSYLATNHGAKGLIYYSYFNIRDDANFQTKWLEIKEVATEIAQLKPVFLSTLPTNDDDIICGNADIDLKLMKKDDAYYLFAVNTKEADIKSVSFDIDLLNIPTSVNTLFEGGGQISVANGTFTDDFGLYEVHIYTWNEPQAEDVDSTNNAPVPATAGGGSGGGGGGCMIGTLAGCFNW